MKVREFCCLKFIFSQAEAREKVLIFKIFCPQTPLNGLGLSVELNLGLEKSGNFILSGKWQPCTMISEFSNLCWFLNFKIRSDTYILKK